VSSRQERAAARQATWGGQIVETGQPKGALYAELSPAERLLALAELNARLWLASGQSLVGGDRRSWPGQVFEIERRG